MVDAPFPVRPLHDRLMIEETEREMKYAIELPGNVKDHRPKHFRVVAVGDGMMSPDGTMPGPTVKPGQVIMVSQRTQGEVVTILGRQIIVIREHDVLAVVNG